MPKRRRRNPLNATQRREKAQDILMRALGTAFYSIEDRMSREANEVDEADVDAMAKEMSKQMERVERLFGYEPKSWPRG